MTELEIVSAIENYVTSNEGVTNFPVSQNQIADELHTVRIRLISDLDKQRQFVRPWDGYVQEIENVATVQEGTDFKIQLARMYTLANGWPAVSYIGSTDWREPFRVVNGNEHMYMDDSEYPDAPYAWVTPSGLVRLRNIESTNISVRAVFEKPQKLEELGFGYDPESSEYPLPGGMIDTIIGKTAESYLKTMYRLFPQANIQADIPISPEK